MDYQIIIKVAVSDAIMNFFADWKEHPPKYPFPHEYEEDEYGEIVPERQEEVRKFHEKNEKMEKRLMKRAEDLGLRLMYSPKLVEGLHPSMIYCTIEGSEQTEPRLALIDDDGWVWVELKFDFYIRLHQEVGAGPLLPLSLLECGLPSGRYGYRKRAVELVDDKSSWGASTLEEVWGTRQQQIEFRRELIELLKDSL